MDTVTVAYGPAANDALRDTIAAAKASDALDPVTVLVPTNYVSVSTRRWLARPEHSPMPGGVGLAGVTFATVLRIGELLAAPVLAAAGRRPVSNAVVASAVRRVLATEPGIFAPVAEHPTTETQLVRTHRELRDLPPRALDTLAEASPRAGEVVRIHRRVAASLRSDWYDEHDLLVAAARAERIPVDQLGHVVVHLPQQLSRAEVALIRHVAGMRPCTVIAGCTGVDPADATVRRSVEALGGRWRPPPGDEPAADLVVNTSDADDEVRWVVRQVLDDLGTGVPYERIAVVYGAHRPYARIVDEHLDAAGIPRNGTSVRRLAETTVGRTALGLLALPDHRFRREEVTAWMAGAPVLHDGRPAPSTAWERISRQAGVVDERDWSVRLERLADDETRVAEAVEGDSEQPEWRATRARRQADQARALAAFVDGLRAELDAGTGASSWSATVAWLRSCLRRHLGGDDRRARWPRDERSAADRIDQALERLAGLDAVEAHVDMATFRRALADELDATIGRVGRLGNGVLTGRPGVALGLDLDRLYVLGMVEGEMPPRIADDSLLPDRERARVAPMLPLRADDTGDEQRYYLAALAASSERVLTWPRGDLRRNAERSASRWALASLSRLAGRPVRADDATEPDLPANRRIASFVAGARDAVFPPTEQDHRLHLLLNGRSPDRLAGDDPGLRLGLELVRARSGDAFTRFDGDLSALAGRHDPFDGVFSATRLQSYATCPHAYLLEYELGVELVENPEDVLELSALDRGSIVHAVLDRYVGGGARPDDIDALAATVFEPYESIGRVGRDVFWQHSRAEILRDLREFVRRDAARVGADGLDLVGTEVAFGLPHAAHDAVSVALPGGRVVRFRGSIDRVDRSTGRLVVIDYKSGSHHSYTGLPEGDPVARGTLLQLPLYAHAARSIVGGPDLAVDAGYWFTTSRRGFRHIGYRVTGRRWRRFVEVIDTLLDQLAAGRYPARDHEIGFMQRGRPSYYDPDGLGARDRAREWQRKRAAPVLAGYVELTEGEPTDQAWDDD